MAGACCSFDAVSGHICQVLFFRFLFGRGGLSGNSFLRRFGFFWCFLSRLSFGLELIALHVLDIVLLHALAHRSELFVESFNFGTLVADSEKERVELFVAYLRGEFLFHSHFEVGEHIHVVGECCKRQSHMG